MELQETYGQGADVPNDPDRPPYSRLRSAFMALAAAAGVAVLVACVLNWLWLTRFSPVPVATTAAIGGEVPTRHEPGTDYLPEGAKPALKMLPPTILQFETTARHAVPGRGQTLAEAMYATLNMDIEAQRPTVVYVSVEVLPTFEAARQKAASVMERFPAGQHGLLIGGVTPAQAGFAADRSAFVIAWQRDYNVTVVKAMFRDTPPVEKRTFLEDQAVPVAGATDAYQRTGKSGIELGTVPTTTPIPGGAPR